uniref:Aquaporin n=1 Tax=Lactuca sativa TaxID=4236 RepID=A0A9R1VB65_LACSA|nr:hypothetical protein LSAT_V11C600339000 [Lactuca sativa]
MGAGGLASIMFGLIADAFGGASFNAIGIIAFSIAGTGGDDDTLMSTAVCFPAQTIGAAGGVMPLLELMPLEYKHLLEGPTLKVDLHAGAIGEGVLTFVITFVVLLIIIKGPNSLFLNNWMLSMATMVVILVGSSYTGPSMNPVNVCNPLVCSNQRGNGIEHYNGMECDSGHFFFLLLLFVNNVVIIKLRIRGDATK